MAPIPWAAAAVADRVRQGFDALCSCRNALDNPSKMISRSYHKLNHHTTNLNRNPPPLESLCSQVASELPTGWNMKPWEPVGDDQELSRVVPDTIFQACTEPCLAQVPKGTYGRPPLAFLMRLLE